MQRSSLHNHSTFCDGRNTPEEMIESAFEAGITDFGISVHSDARLFVGHEVCSEREYIDALKRVKADNKLDIRFYIGVEEDLFVPVLLRGEYDYVIGSTHHIAGNGRTYAVDGSEEEFLQGAEEVFGGDAYAYAERYFSQVLECAKKHPDILGHFDLIRKNGGKFIDFSGKKYRDLALSCAEACIAEGVIFEVNYGAIPRKRLDSPYPTDEVLTLIRQRGGRVTLSTDCHDREYIAFGLSEGEEKLRSLGFTSLSEFSGGRFKERKL